MQTPEKIKAKILQLRASEMSFERIANTLNGLRWIPERGRQFTAGIVAKLLKKYEAEKCVQIVNVN